MTFRDENCWAIILGGSSGIGIAAAERLSKEGMHICIVHHDLKSRVKMAETAFRSIAANGVSFESFNLDATNASNVQKVSDDLLKKYGKVKVKVLLHAISKGNLKTIVPNRPNRTKDVTNDIEEHFNEINKKIDAEIEHLGMLGSTDIELTQHAMSNSLLVWVQQLLNNSMLDPGSRIIALTSEGNKRIWPSYAAIAMAKASLETMIKYLARELAQYGVTANAIQAGITETPSLNMIPGSNVIKASARSRNPFGRLTTPLDVANFIYLLCCEEASWVNGAIIPVDGGEHFN